MHSRASEAETACGCILFAPLCERVSPQLNELGWRSIRGPHQSRFWIDRLAQPNLGGAALQRCGSGRQTDRL